MLGNKPDKLKSFKNYHLKITYKTDTMAERLLRLKKKQ